MQPTQSRWPMFERVTRRADRMERMFDLSNTDILAAVREEKGEAVSRARTKCLECHSGARCRAWLAASKAQKRGAEVPDFCPNARFLEKFRRARS